AAHDWGAAVGPGEQETWTIGAPAHAVVSSAERSPDDHGDLRDLCRGDRRHELGAVLGNAPRFVFLPDHETRNILQEQQGCAPLAAQLDEMRALERRFGIEDSVIGDDADLDSQNLREPGDERGTIELLEFAELGI